MKQLHLLIISLLQIKFYCLIAQTIFVDYTPIPLSVQITNPERGFYQHTEVYSSKLYNKLDQNTLNNYRSRNFTLVLRVFYLEKFLNNLISNEYLQEIDSDFNKIRIAGLKCIVRFAYSNSEKSIGYFDAKKDFVLAHIIQLKPFLVKNSDVILVMQAGFIGAWGEWYYTDNFGYPTVTATDYSNRQEIVDAILSALPLSRMVQLRTPLLKQKLYSSTQPLTKEQAFKGTNVARIGHHNDCFLASSTDYGTYTNILKDYPYLEQETNYTPMGGETCAVNKPRSECQTALNEMEKFHWSYLNIGYNEMVLNDFKTGGCFTTIQNRLGYRYELIKGIYPLSATSSFSILLEVFNRGFASVFNERTAYLVLRNTITNLEYSIALKTDIRFWSSGIKTTVYEEILLPKNIVLGNYKLYLNLPDASVSLKNRPEYSISLANDGILESQTGYNYLNHIIKIY